MDSISDCRWQFVLKELLALTLVVGVGAGICQQGTQAGMALAAVSLPLSGPGLMLWGSIFEHPRMEACGAGISLLIPLLLMASAVMLPAF